MDSKIVILLLTLGIVVTVDVKGQSLHDRDHSSQGEVSWATDCGGSGQLLKHIQLTGCLDGNCTLAASRSYNLSIPEFSPGRNYTYLTFIVSATPTGSNRSMTLIFRTMSGDFQENETYSVADQIVVDDTFMGSLTKDWTIRMEIVSNDKEIIVCQTFPIKISEEFDGLECDTAYESCGFENSLCRPENSHYVCQCDYSFVSIEDAMGEIRCKGMIGTVCANDDACIPNAECVNYNAIKICACKSGYGSSDPTDFTECRRAVNSASSLFYSFGFSSLLAFLVILQNSIK